MIRNMIKIKIILSYNQANYEWTIINIKDIKNSFFILFSNNNSYLYKILNNPKYLKYLYNNYFNEYGVFTDYLNGGDGRGYGGDNLLSNNKFNTKSMFSYSYQDLINNKYNNIYAFEILSPTNYRILNVNKIN